MLPHFDIVAGIIGCNTKEPKGKPMLCKNSLNDTGKTFLRLQTMKQLEPQQDFMVIP
jgi:hypothetical protein